MANFYETLGELGYDNIENSAGTVPVITGMRTVQGGQGGQDILKRGTALAITAAGKMIILGSAAGTANCILAADVDARGNDANALVYLSGHFNKNKLTVATSYTITDADIEAFRAAGIYLENAM